MLFSSNIFLFYFLPLFLFLIFILPKKLLTLFIILSSLFFFAWGAPTFIFILLIFILIDYFLAGWLERPVFSARKAIMWAGILLNLSLLIYYKYAAFFIENLNVLVSRAGFTFNHPSKNLVLPLGISFFTFHKISFLIDVYRKKKGRGSFVEYLNYILFFPKILSGPILKWRESGSQFSQTPDVSNQTRFEGFFRFSAGLFQKVWIADVIGMYINPVFIAAPESISSAQMWVTVFAYSFQIFFDFSAYTDMAIGLANMMGFRLPENFNHPYLARNIREFWQRWHISLTAWFKEYLFMPLAFNFSRKLKNNSYLSIKTDYIIYSLAVFITFLLTGFWHGAGWTFILWGAYHGILLIADRLFLFRFFRKAGAFISGLLTFLLVMFGWILFRAENLLHFKTIWIKMFSFDGIELNFRPLFYVALGLSVFITILPSLRKTLLFKNIQVKYPAPLRFLFYLTLLVLSLAGISSQGFYPFIYFRF